MNQPHILVMVGSIRQDSHNLKLAKALMKLGAHDFNFHIATISDLPLFSEDLEKDFPQAALRLKKEIEMADGVLFVTPEYNRSVPGLLKNAIDWASRPYGKNSFAKKPAAICGISVGTIGTACAQASLKHILSYLEIQLMGQPEVYLQFQEGLIDAEGHIHHTSTEKFLQDFMKKFAQWVQPSHS